MVEASPRTLTESITNDPAELATATLAGEDGTPPELALAKARRLVSCTAPVSETDPATQRFGANRLTVTVAVPDGGFASAQISVRKTTTSDWPPMNVRDWPA
jgi:hypothetical protein